ncbi:hypothetical protein BTVI_124707 [Pitangus sulphuratus]|nr:hypothetical protein BTVI_124707 [Pitangus sulphuratus]
MPEERFTVVSSKFSFIKNASKELAKRIAKRLCTDHLFILIVSTPGSVACVKHIWKGQTLFLERRDERMTRAVYYLAEDDIHSEFQEFPGLPTAFYAAFPSDIMVVEFPSRMTAYEHNAFCRWKIVVGNSTELAAKSYISFNQDGKEIDCGIRSIAYPQNYAKYMLKVNGFLILMYSLICNIQYSARSSLESCLEEEVDLHLATTSFQIVVESNKVFKPPILQFHHHLRECFMATVVMSWHNLYYPFILKLHKAHLPQPDLTYNAKERKMITCQQLQSDSDAFPPLCCENQK